MTIHHSPLFLSIFAVSALMIGVGKGGLGPTFAASATPLLALVLPVDQVLVLPGDKRAAAGGHDSRPPRARAAPGDQEPGKSS